MGGRGSFKQDLKCACEGERGYKWQQSQDSVFLVHSEVAAIEDTCRSELVEGGAVLMRGRSARRTMVGTLEPISALEPLLPLTATRSQQA